jgi:hypothetical protein
MGATFGLGTTTSRLGALTLRLGATTFGLGAITSIYEHKHDPAQKDEN